MPGKIWEFRAFAYASRQRIMPPRGPRSVLCVVVVTISAYGTGFGWSPTATSPAMCAMSTTIAAPTSRAISANWSNASVRGYALAPTTRIFGLCSRASRLTSAMSMVSLSRARPYGTILKSFPEKLTGEPWVRCPPKLRLIARSVSPVGPPAAEPPQLVASAK